MSPFKVKHLQEVQKINKIKLTPPPPAVTPVCIVSALKLCVRVCVLIPWRRGWAGRALPWRRCWHTRWRWRWGGRGWRRWPREGWSGAASSERRASGTDRTPDNTQASSVFTQVEVIKYRCWNVLRVSIMTLNCIQTTVTSRFWKCEEEKFRCGEEKSKKYSSKVQIPEASTSLQ